MVGANFNLVAGREDAQGKVYLFEGLTRFLTGSAATLQFTPVENGDFRVSVLVADDDGGSGASTLNVTIANGAPQNVSAGPDRVVNEGQPVNLAASFADPGATDTQTIAWHVEAGNGQVIADGASATFSFTPVDDGIYTVTLTVTDDDGGVGTGTLIVTANNVAPQANAGPDQTATEGQTVNLTGGFVDPGVNDAQSFLWQVTSTNGQIVPNSNSPNYSFTPADSGIYSVTLTVTDNNGASSADSAIVTVLNRPPTVAGVIVNYGLEQRSRVTALTVRFSEDVATSLGVGAFVLVNRTTGATATATSLVYDSLARNSTLTFEGLPGQQLPDGQYLFTVRGDAVADIHGARMAADFHFEFHSLKGDADGDLATNDHDLYLVWQSLLLPLAQRDLNYDLDGDGLVTAADVDVVKSKFLATLRIPQPASPVDLNGDGIVNDRDLYIVWSELLKPPPQRNLNYDLDGDGSVTTADVNVVKNNFLTVVSWAVPNKSGDVNGDGLVNDSDLYTVWQEFLKSPAARNRTFDLNRDGEVTLFDVNLVKNQFSTIQASPGPSALVGGVQNSLATTQAASSATNSSQLAVPVSVVVTSVTPAQNAQISFGINTADLGRVPSRRGPDAAGQRSAASAVAFVSSALAPQALEQLGPALQSDVKQSASEVMSAPADADSSAIHPLKSDLKPVGTANKGSDALNAAPLMAPVWVAFPWDRVGRWSMSGSDPSHSVLLATAESFKDFQPFTRWSEFQLESNCVAKVDKNDLLNMFNNPWSDCAWTRPPAQKKNSHETL